MVATACGGGGSGASGSSGGGGGAGGHGKHVVIGTTDKVVSFDPANTYDQGSWTPMHSMYQTLLHYKPGSTKPVGNAAKSCEFTDPTHLQCTMRPGQKFWNGDPLTAKDVVYSFKRNVRINSPKGEASALDVMKNIKTKGKNKVVFTLKYPFTAFKGVLTDEAMAIVDPKVFPKDKVISSNKIVGSGPYEMTTFKRGQQLVLKPNPHYNGPLKLQNSGVVVQYFSKPSALKLAVEQGDVDVAFRKFSPTAIASLKKESNKGVHVVQGQGAAIQYIVFNLKVMPGKSDQQKLAIRKAAAMSVDRQAIAKNVYNGTVQPLYSMVPSSLPASVPVFKKAYGAHPDKAKAKQTLAAAGVQTPVKLNIWWTPSHYGPGSVDMYTDIKRQLEGTGLFKVSLHSAEWDQYDSAFPTDKYPVFQLGWFPDYPDADDYVAPFFGKNSFLKAHYSNPKIDKLIQNERGTSDKSTRKAAFAKIQKISAKDVPTVPLTQSKEIAVTHGNVSGVKETLDPSYTFRYWLISKS
jgi:peptide/nickel transport system substrate-binding protein